MTSRDKQAKIDQLRAAAKDAQAELGFIALQREAQDARWKALKEALAAGEAEYRQVLDVAVVDAETQLDSRPRSAE